VQVSGPMASDKDLVNALRDHATTLEQTTSAANDSHDRDIDAVEKARALAYASENGTASEEDKGRVADTVHPSVKTRYGL
jgi:hypothetical protein